MWFDFLGSLPAVAKGYLDTYRLGHIPHIVLVRCLTLATYLPYLLLPTETKVQSRDIHMQKTQHTVVHTHTNLRVSSFCVGHALREFETPPPFTFRHVCHQKLYFFQKWPKLGTWPRLGTLLVFQ